MASLVRHLWKKMAMMRVIAIQDWNLVLNYFVADIGLKRIILRGDITGEKNNIELITKKISDRVYESITGLKGIFNTKLAYILNPEPNK